MSNWDVSKAAAWINSLGEVYQKYAENFVANQVDGEVLLKYVDQDSIRDLVDMKLHQRVVLGALDHLKAQVRVVLYFIVHWEMFYCFRLLYSCASNGSLAIRVQEIKLTIGYR